jgi:hypothetical protein
MTIWYIHILWSFGIFNTHIWHPFFWLPSIFAYIQPPRLCESVQFGWMDGWMDGWGANAIWPRNCSFYTFQANAESFDTSDNNINNFTILPLNIMNLQNF